jgi:hypothetical protein
MGILPEIQMARTLPFLLDSRILFDQPEDAFSQRLKINFWLLGGMAVG